jgi:ribonuclease HII
MAPLKATYENQCMEAGVDEAGRGCLAGPVFAAAVIFNTHIPLSITQHLNDSKKLSQEQRNRLRTEIEMHALSWAIGVASNEEIDQINILNASFLAMHRALEKLRPQPELLLIDGNRFKPYRQTRHACIVKGDGMYLSIAAASVLAKTYRDDFMYDAHLQLPQYCWDKNKGYPTLQHKMAIAQFGLSPLHRKSFNSGLQTKLDL